jgi:hypothetical protein
VALALGGRTHTVATEIEADTSLGELGGAAA